MKKGVPSQAIKTLVVDCPSFFYKDCRDTFVYKICMHAGVADDLYQFG